MTPKNGDSNTFLFGDFRQATTSGKAGTLRDSFPTLIKASPLSSGLLNTATKPRLHSALAPSHENSQPLAKQISTAQSRNAITQEVSA